MDRLINIALPAFFFAVALFFFLRLKDRWQLSWSSRKMVFYFSLKVLAGLCLTWVYTQYYPHRNLADTYRYFDDAMILYQEWGKDKLSFLKILFGFQTEQRNALPVLEQMNNWFPAERSPLYNDNRTVIRINAFIRWFSGGNYYVHLLAFLSMGFAGLMLLYKDLSKALHLKSVLSELVVFALPSVVFWSSGILKEGPLFLVFAILVHQLLAWCNKGVRWPRIVFMLLLLFVLFHLKFYVGLLLLPIVSFVAIKRKWGRLKTMYVVLINYLFYFTFAIVWHYIRWKWSLFTVFKWKKKDFQGLAQVMESKSYIKTYDLEDNALSFLINIPQGLFNAITRPFLWEVYSPLVLFSALENILVILCALFCLLNRKKTPLTLLQWSMFIYSVSLLTVVGMVTPIMGSLVRYKIPALPILLLFFVSIVDWGKVSQKFNRKRHEI